jgi:hypothetical protein
MFKINISTRIPSLLTAFELHEFVIFLNKSFRLPFLFDAGIVLNKAKKLV